jgi:hypothetical protein
VPGIRGRGVALALGFHALRYASEGGFTSASWLTAPSNKTAQRIYDGIGAKKSDWFMYEVVLAGRKLESGSG